MPRAYLVQLYRKKQMKTIDNDTFFAWVEEELAAGREVSFRLKGTSMFPLLRNGKDVVLLAHCAPESLKPMDVVLFRYKGKHLLHRIIRRDGDNLLLQGDGSIVAKETCSVHEVVGKVFQVRRPSGKTISVESLQWRFFGRLWRNLGFIRKCLLRVLNYFKSRD